MAGNAVNSFFLPAVFVTLIGLVSASCSYAKERPNVLLILVDDLKPSFGAYGQSWVRSPNLDRLARRGIQFNAAYCNQAVCAPSRVNLMLGSRSTSLGIYDLSINFRVAQSDAVTMPQYFMKNGYHASGVGKVFHIGHGNTGDAASWSEPFQPDKVVDYVLEESTGGQLTREEAYFSNRELNRIHELPRGAAWERADVPDDAYADGRIANKAIACLQKSAERQEPFFLAVGFVKPHLPSCAPEKYWKVYDDIELPIADVRVPPKDAPDFAGKPRLDELNQYKPIPNDPPLSPDLERTLVHGYYASLSYMDAQLGKVLDELERLGLAENTIVVLWGDHGYHLGDHGMWTKHTNYEQANRIPLIFAGPGIVPNTQTSAVVETVDIYPTLAELAGLELPIGPQPIDGESLVPVIRSPTMPTRDHAYHAFPRGGNRLGRAIRTDRYRLVEWKRFDQSAEEAVYELYDYQEDPLETRNLAAEKPDVVQELVAILRRHPEAKPPIKQKG